MIDPLPASELWVGVYVKRGRRCGKKVPVTNPPVTKPTDYIPTYFFLRVGHGLDR